MPHSFIKRIPKARQSINSLSVFNGLPYDRLTSLCLHITSQAMQTTTAPTGSSQSPQKLTAFCRALLQAFFVQIFIYISITTSIQNIASKGHIEQKTIFNVLCVLHLLRDDTLKHSKLLSTEIRNISFDCASSSRLLIQIPRNDF